MSQDTSIDMRQLQDLLPGYVNGSLSGAQRQLVKTALSQSAQARAALAWHEALAEKVINDVESAPPDLGWAALQAKVRATSRVAAAGAGNGSWERLRQWARDGLKPLEALMPHRWLPGPALSGVCAALLAVVVAQAWFAPENRGANEFGVERGSDKPVNVTTSSSGLEGARFVRLNFKNDVSERDMRLLLIRTGAVLVSGPGQLGDYTVAVPAAEIDRALGEFKASLLTESVREAAAPSWDARISGTTGAAPGASIQKTTP